MAKEYFGEDKVGDFGLVPHKGSEDFPYFLQQKPGCYFFLTTIDENHRII